MPLPPISELTKALTAAGLDIAGASVVTDVASPATFLRCGKQIVRLDWKPDTTPRNSEARNALFKLAGGELVEVIE